MMLGISFFSFEILHEPPIFVKQCWVYISFILYLIVQLIGIMYTL